MSLYTSKKHWHSVISRLEPDEAVTAPGLNIFLLYFLLFLLCTFQKCTVLWFRKLMVYNYGNWFRKKKKRWCWQELFSCSMMTDVSAQVWGSGEASCWLRNSTTSEWWQNTKRWHINETAQSKWTEEKHTNHTNSLTQFTLGNMNTFYYYLIKIHQLNCKHANIKEHKAPLSGNATKLPKHDNTVKIGNPSFDLGRDDM